MSDRTQGSVRTGSRPGDTSTAQGPDDGQQAGGNGSSPVSATQSITATGAQRAQAPVDGTAPVAGTPVSTTKAPAARGSEAPVARGSEAPVARGSEAPAARGADATLAAPAPAPAPSELTQAAPAGATPAPVPVATGSSPATGAGKAATGKQKGARGPRRARLQLRHIDTWSALKISLVLSIAMFFIWMVAVGVLYGVLSGLGVFETLNDLFGQLGTASGAEGTSEVITPGIVFGGAAVIGAINIVLMTALCTVAAFIYNMCSDLVGGLEVTLSERD
ncbi:DUF3566 domain-containing protein [Geodermatophilus sp. CPCC 206100]|uniref:DUF3566 domain-containing protein n=1 Tax=Geodermatophilus sp. CPCC 206100 TaxID=3020054 RepID=UPI003AFF6813